MEFTTLELEAYLNEALPPERMACIEEALRDQPEVADQLSSVLTRLNSGVHSIGAIWRNHRLSCPTREQLGSYLLKILDTEQLGYVKFHLDVVGCRFCNASLDDLEHVHTAEKDSGGDSRRAKYFQSTAGYLAKE